MPAVNKENISDASVIAAATASAPPAAPSTSKGASPIIPMVKPLIVTGKVPEGLEGKTMEVDPEIFKEGPGSNITHEDTTKSNVPAKPTQAKEDATPEKAPVKQGEEKVSKVEQTPAKEGTKELKPPVISVEAKPKLPAKRDLLTELDPDFAKVLRQTPNGVYGAIEKYLKPLVDGAKKVKELETENTTLKAQPKLTVAKEELHPQAYTLDPEYEKSTGILRQADGELDFYTQQLVNIEKNQPWRILQSIDKNGNVTYSEPQQPNAESKIRIQGAISDLQRVKADTQAKVTALRDGYGTAYKADEEAILAGNRKYFPWEADDKLQEEKIPVDGKEFTIKEIRDEIISTFPKRFQSNPVAKTAANLYVANLKLAINLHKTMEENEMLKRETEIEKVIEPHDESNGSPSNGEDKRFVMEPNFLD